MWLVHRASLAWLPRFVVGSGVTQPLTAHSLGYTATVDVCAWYKTILRLFHPYTALICILCIVH
jgi:hypothetical protein